MNTGLDSLAQDSAALASAASAAEEALQLEREALSVLRDTWTGESATAAIDFLDAHCREGEAVVSALRHAAAVLSVAGDSTDLLGEPIDAGLADRPPANFSAPVPPPVAAAPAAAPAMNWPTGGSSALPDIGSAIADLIAQAADSLSADSLSADSLNADALSADPVLADPPADSTKPVAPDPPVEPPVAEPAPAPPATVAAPLESLPLLGAEVPPSQPSPPAEVPAPTQASVPESTPCEIAADELPQIGQ